MSKKWNKYLIVGLIITVLYALAFLMNRNTVMLWYDDCFSQSSYFLDQLSNDSFHLFGWDRTSFLGNPTFTATAFYYGTNLPIILYAKLVSLGPLKFFVMNYLCSLALGFSCLVWLNRWSSNDLAEIAGSAVIVFGGWTMVYFKYPFLPIYWALPLILHAIDLFFDKNNGLPLALMVALTGLLNYFFVLLFTPFAFLYTLFIYFYSERYSDLKAFLCKALSFFRYYFLGLLMSSFISLPCIIQMIKAPRKANGSLLQLMSVKDLFSLITSFVTPVSGVNEHNAFISSSQSSLTYGGGPGVYSLALSLLVVPQFFVTASSSEKKTVSLLLLFITVLTLWKGIYPLLNATWDSRWIYMINYVNAFIVARTINRKDSFSKTLAKTTVITVILMIAVTFVISYKLQLFPSRAYLKLLVIEEVAFIAIIISYVLFYRNDLHFLMIVFADCALSFLMIFMPGINKDYSSSLVTKSSYDAITKNVFDVGDYIRTSLKDSDYRINEINKNSYASNTGLAKGYQSYTLYTSLYNYEIEELANGRFKGYGQWHFLDNVGLNNLKELFGTKYYADFDSKLPEPFGYQYVDTINGIDLYQNTMPLSIGFAMDKDLNADVYKDLSKHDQNRLLLNYVVIDESSNTQYEFTDNQQTIQKDRYGFNIIDTGSFDQGIVYIKEHSDYSMLFTRAYEFWQNDTLLTENAIYTDFPLEFSIKDETAIAVDIRSHDALGYDLGYDVVYDDLSWYEDWYENLADEQLEIKKISSNTIEGSIDLKEDKWILMTVAYDKGWSAYVDGEEVKIYKADEGLMAIRCAAGSHNIVFKYETYGLRTGMYVSAVSCVILLINEWRKYGKKAVKR